MTYELAQELERHGFQKKAHNCDELPTLSELIEACGEGEFCLTHYFSQKAGWIWQADKNLFEDKEAVQQKGHGSTPEEAVAKLWLALNKP